MRIESLYAYRESQNTVHTAHKRLSTQTVLNAHSLSIRSLKILFALQTRAVCLQRVYCTQERVDSTQTFLNAHRESIRRLRLESLNAVCVWTLHTQYAYRESIRV